MNIINISEDTILITMDFIIKPGRSICDKTYPEVAEKLKEKLGGIANLPGKAADTITRIITGPSA